VANKETAKVNNSESTKTQKKPESSSFVEDTKQELAKIVWPSRQQLLSESAAVMLMVVLVATTIYLIDNIFGWIAGKVF
jgi:preprotein translocase subunit SecE